MLVELYMEMSEWEKAVQLCNKISSNLPQDRVPLDISVNHGICYLQLGDLASAVVRLLLASAFYLVALVID
jgi:lipopolysaccharide biosynthesis regulator YciM